MPEKREKSYRGSRTGSDKPDYFFLFCFSFSKEKKRRENIFYANSDHNNIQTINLADTAQWYKATLDLQN